MPNIPSQAEDTIPDAAYFIGDGRESVLFTEVNVFQAALFKGKDESGRRRGMPAGIWQEGDNLFLMLDLPIYNAKSAFLPGKYY